MTRTFAVLAVTTVSACGGPTSTAAPATPANADLATVPLHVEGNRPFVELTFHKPDGTTRNARFLVDSGGGGFLIVEPLAKELGLALGETMNEEGSTFAAVTSAVHVSIGSVALDLDPERVLAVVGATNMLPPAAPGHADGLLPGHVLAHYHVVFDYPKRTFTIARPKALASTGTPIAMPVATPSGFPRTEIEVGGTAYPVLLDTGASFTMVSQTVLEGWGSAHPEWKREKGAVGEAATLGGQALETMILPKLTWDGHALGDVGVVSQQAGVFEKWMSSMMTAPIVGSLAGNVLTRFRVDLDYPEQKLYLSGP
jgi:predicted aspartyl protease